MHLIVIIIYKLVFSKFKFKRTTLTGLKDLAGAIRSSMSNLIFLHFFFYHKRKGICRAPAPDCVPEILISSLESEFSSPFCRSCPRIYINKKFAYLMLVSAQIVF